MKKLLLLFFALTSLAKAQFTTTNVITGLPYPVCFTIAPDGRYFVSCKGGVTVAANAQVRTYSSSGTLAATLWDFTDSVEVYFERGVLGVEVDPNFSTNHYVYVFYNHKTPAKIRVVRFTEVAGVGTNPTIIFDVDDPNTAGNHTGGNIHFRPSEPDKLYISIGDRADDEFKAQDLARWEGKMLRINTDGTIPTDNPYYDDGNPSTGNDDRIWSWGHRNAFDFCFSTVNDSLYSSENGLNTQDEVNLVERGKNYGWPYCEGTGAYLGSCTGYEAPLETWNAPLPSLTGIIFYTSTVMPTYTNHLIVTDYNDGNVWNITLGNAPVYDQFVSRSLVTGLSFTSLTDIEQGADGCWYLLNGGYTASGKITRVCPVGMGLEEETLSNAIQVVPNPATNTISVSGNNASFVNVYDFNGKLVLVSTEKTVNIESLPKGVYQVRTDRSSTRFVKL